MKQVKHSLLYSKKHFRFETVLGMAYLKSEQGKYKFLFVKTAILKGTILLFQKLRVLDERKSSLLVGYKKREYDGLY